MRPPLVIGIGNDWRGDDAAGLIAARYLAATWPGPATVAEADGEPARLMALWEGVDAVWLVDACVGAAGTINRFDAAAAPLPAMMETSSSHGFGLAASIELARALNAMPASLIVFAIAGERFETGTAASRQVARAAHAAARRIADELAATPTNGAP